MFQNFLRHVPEISWTISSKLPGHFQDISRTFPGFFFDFSGNVPNIVSGQKNEKTNDLCSILGVFLERFGGDLGVFEGGFWREFGGEVFSGNITYKIPI